MLVRLPGIILCVAVACRADTYLEALKLSHEKKGHYFYKQPTEEMPQISSSVFPHSLDILVLLGKILLKLVIFKLFVKFFALICLLLFVPTLKLVHSEKPVKEGNLY